MKSSLRKGISLVLAALLLLSFAACGSKGEEQKTTEPSKQVETEETKKTEETKAEPEPVTVSFISYFMEGETAEATAVAYHQIMDKFLEENKHVTLEEEILAHDAYEQKVISLAAANDLPDLFQFKALWVSNFVNNGLAGEVNSFLDADPEWKSGFIEGTFDEFTVDGKIYAVPYQVATVANLFYNKGIFEEVGIKTFPKNMTEFKEAIKILKDNGYIPIAAGNKGGWFVDVCIFRGILDRYAGPEWSVSITKRTGAKFTDPEFVAALRELKEIAELGAFNDDINSIDYMQMRNYFYTRKAAMMLDGSGGILPFTQEAPESIINETEITVLPPLEEGGKSIGNPGTAGWALGYSSKVEGAKLDVVEKILKALSSQEYARIVAENNGFPAVNPGEYDKSKLSPLTVKYNEMLAKYPVTFLANLDPAVLEVLYGGLQEILIGTVTPVDLAERLQEEMDNLG